MLLFELFYHMMLSRARYCYDKCCPSPWRSGTLFR